MLTYHRQWEDKPKCSPHMNQWNEYWYHCSPINWPLFCTKRGQYTFFLTNQKGHYIALVHLKYQEKNNASPTFRRALFSFYQRMTHLLIVYSSLSWLVSACTDSFLVATSMILRQTFEKALCSIHGVHHPKINIWKTFWNIHLIMFDLLCFHTFQCVNVILILMFALCIYHKLYKPCKVHSRVR